MLCAMPFAKPTTCGGDTARWDAVEKGLREDPSITSRPVHGISLLPVEEGDEVGGVAKLSTVLLRHGGRVLLSQHISFTSDRE